jgi:hypothetical protein
MDFIFEHLMMLPLRMSFSVPAIDTSAAFIGDGMKKSRLDFM